jgi:hypothetical protein
MTEKIHNPLAFPMSVPLGFYLYQDGMTLRDYFAGQALVGLLAGRKPDAMFTNEDATKSAYYMADAMLEARGEYDD